MRNANAQSRAPLTGAIQDIGLPGLLQSGSCHRAGQPVKQGLK